MIITRTSDISGIERSKELPVTQAQLRAYYEKGMLLQNAFPDIDKADREFIKTGITQEEWDAVFKD